MEMPNTDLKIKDLVDFLGTWFHHFLNSTSAIKVTNPAELRDEKTIKEENKKTIDALSSISKELKDAISSISIPEPKEEVSVSNLKDVVFPVQKDIVFPKEFAVSNLKDIVIPEAKEAVFPDSFKVSNLKDLKIPEPLKELLIKNFPKLQDIQGTVSVQQFGDLLSGIQTVVDSINALEGSIGNIANIPQVVATSMGSNRSSSSNPVINRSADETVRGFDNGTYYYFGFATPATSTSSAFWKVIRVENTTGSKVFADGNALYDNVWDNYLTLSYS